MCCWLESSSRSIINYLRGPYSKNLKTATRSWEWLLIHSHKKIRTSPHRPGAGRLRANMWARRPWTLDKMAAQLTSWCGQPTETWAEQDLQNCEIFLSCFTALWMVIWYEAIKRNTISQAWWYMPVIPAAQEIEIKHTIVQDQPR
jgi:hypothetical protein